MASENNLLNTTEMSSQHNNVSNDKGSSVMRRISTELLSRWSGMGSRPQAPQTADGKKTLDSMADDSTLLEGRVFKKGKAADSEFLERWFKVSKLAVSYAINQETGPLDNISFNDIIGVVAENPDARTEDKPADTHSNTGNGGGQSPIGSVSMRPAGQRPSSYAWSQSEQHSRAGSAPSLRGSRRLNSRAVRGMAGGTFAENHWRPGEWEEKAEADQVALGPCEWMIVTSRGGYHGGRQFVLRSETVEGKERWVETMSRVLELYADTAMERASRVTKLRRKVRWFYVGDRCQIFVASLIMGNFLTNIFEAQFAAEPGSQTANIFDNVDIAFTVIFTVELLVNMFATLVREFVVDGWNWFDVVVVLVSLLSLGMSDLPGADILRLMRCFRVFRLFKRIPSLRQIIVALSASVPPMINAFALVCLVSAIYAIMSVTFFRSIDPENFGDFFTAMFTMFQVMTGDNWSDIARGLFTASGNGPATAVFFVSFQLIVALVLVNVVIAVLLDEFSKAALSKSQQSAGLDEGNCACPFVRLADALASYADLDDLELKIHTVFAQIGKVGLPMVEMDLEAPQEQITLDFAEFRAGVKNLDFIPPILISGEDWEEQVVHRGLADDEERLGVRGFTELMKHSVRRYQTWSLHTALEEEAESWEKEQFRAMYLGVKGLLAEDQENYRLAHSGGGGGEGGLRSTSLHHREEEAATDELLRRVLGDMGRLNKRFDAVERELVAAHGATNANANANTEGSTKPKTRKLLASSNASSSPPIQLPKSSLQEERGAKKDGRKHAEANGDAEGKDGKKEGEFIGRVAYSRRTATRGGKEDDGGGEVGEKERGKENGGKKGEAGKEREKARKEGGGGAGEEEGKENGKENGRPSRRREEKEGGRRELKARTGSLKAPGGDKEKEKKGLERAKSTVDKSRKKDAGPAGRDDQLTHRTRNPEELGQQGWGFFTQQFMERHPAGALKEPANVLEQSGQAVNNLVGGILGGLSAFGNALPFGQGNDANADTNGAATRGV